MTKLMNTSERFQDLVQRKDRPAEVGAHKSLVALHKLEAKLPDLVFSSKDPIDHLGQME